MIKAALVEYLKARAHTDKVRSAFDKTLKQHAEAFDKLKAL
ncbi:MAG TPA: hypothetical protein VI029_19915 [Mycobacterium sp.]